MWATWLVTVGALIVGVIIGVVGSPSAPAPESQSAAVVPGAVNDPEQPAEPVTPVDEPAAEPVKLSGDGNATTKKVELSGDFAIAWKTKADCYYSADIENGEDFPEQAFTADVATSGESNVYGLEGEYWLEVITGPSCPWVVTFTQQ